MREDLLHFIWKTKKVFKQELRTTEGDVVEVLQAGEHNHFAGPDFFNAKIQIEGQLWAGNIEMHLKASDWYVHGHETDHNYENVILHVVWEDDIAIFRKDGTTIPALQLKTFISKSFLDGYQDLLNTTKVKFINCEKDFSQVDTFLVESWFESLYVERLEQKTQLVLQLLDKSKNNWEAVLFTLLMKSFGTKRNQDSFLQIAASIDFSVIRKLSSTVFALESVLLGQAKLLESQDKANHQLKVYQKEYAFHKTKFGLSNGGVEQPQFFGLRPNNFPTIRLSQLANLYAKSNTLFTELMGATTTKTIYSLFKIEASEYWQTSYTFNKASKPSKKRLTKSFIDLVIINTLIPLKFAYLQHKGNLSKDEVFNVAKALKPERNAIIDGFSSIGSVAANAFDTQSRLQLYNTYCSKNKCLQCKVGARLLNKNT